MNLIQSHLCPQFTPRLQAAERPAGAALATVHRCSSGTSLGIKWVTRRKGDTNRFTGCLDNWTASVGQPSRGRRVFATYSISRSHLSHRDNHQPRRHARLHPPKGLIHRDCRMNGRRTMLGSAECRRVLHLSAAQESAANCRSGRAPKASCARPQGGIHFTPGAAASDCPGQMSCGKPEVVIPVTSQTDVHPVFTKTFQQFDILLGDRGTGWLAQPAQSWFHSPFRSERRPGNEHDKIA